MSQPTVANFALAMQLSNILQFFLFRKLYPNKTLSLRDLWDAMEGDAPPGESFRLLHTVDHLYSWLSIFQWIGGELSVSGTSYSSMYSLTDKGREYVEEEAARQGISLKELQGIDGLTPETMTFVAHVKTLGNGGPIQLNALVTELNEISQGAGLPLINVQMVCNAIQPAINAGLITAVHKNRGGSEFSITPAGTQTLKRWIELCHADGFLLEVPVPA